MGNAGPVSVLSHHKIQRVTPAGPRPLFSFIGRTPSCFLLFLLMITMVLLPGCAGTRFTRISEDQLSLGHKTMQSIRDQLGKPYQEGTVLKNGQTLKALSYSFSQASAQGAFGGPTLNRAQTFFFHNGILVGHVYFSTQEQDKTDFDPSKVEEIKENQTSIEEAVNLLGRPSGEYVYPLISGKNDRAKVYGYAQLKTAFLKWSQYQQYLVISYNTAGVVTKVEFVESGVK